MILFLILALILPVLSRAIIKINGYSRGDRGFFNQCVTCTLIPKNGIKTHQCNKTKETFKIDSPVKCVTKNVIYRITCKKPKCKTFVSIGQTKPNSNTPPFRRHSADSLPTHRRRSADVPPTFRRHSAAVHRPATMLPIILEEVTYSQK